MIDARARAAALNARQQITDPLHVAPRRGRRGNCYVTCEALYYLLGGKASGWVPHSVRHGGDVHWYLMNVDVILDPTGAQFDDPPPYHLGRGRGFLTGTPSRRAKDLMDRMLWQEQSRSAMRSQKHETGSGLSRRHAMPAAARHAAPRR